MPIAFSILDTSNGFLQRRALRNWLSHVAESEGFSLGELNYVLMSDPELLKYNQQYLQHDNYTDVITFHVGEKGDVISGDILISYDRVKENARNLQEPVQQELRRVMVHGLLHLCGHDDSTLEQKSAFRALENRYLQLYR